MTEARRRVLEALDRQYKAAGRIRVAAEEAPPPPLPQGGFEHEAAGNLKRAIPAGYSYDPNALKPLAKTLWAMSVSLGHAMNAHSEFTKLKSGLVSPDGLIGGRGYVMSIKDMRKTLYAAVEGLSAISDTIHDEINAPHWKPKLAQLEKDDIEDIGELVGDAQRILDDPEGEAEEDMEEAEKGKGKTKGAPWTHPAVAKKNKGKGKNSELPDGGDAEIAPDTKDKQSDPGQPMNRVQKQASRRGPAPCLDRDITPAVGSRFVVIAEYSYERTANSSVPVQYLPGGPRVDHIDRGNNDGNYNDAEPALPQGDDGTYVQSDPGKSYDYPSGWENEFNKGAASAVPDAVTDQTPTQGFDYGLGLSEGNDAHGQGQNHEVKGPGGGVYSPSAELPGDLAGGGIEEDDSTAVIEQSVGSGRPVSAIDAFVAVVAAAKPKRPIDAFMEAVATKNACEGGCSGNCKGACSCGGSELPNDGEPEVARSDYYQASTALPGDGQSVTNEHDMDMNPGIGYRYEQTNQPYIKWDSTTHQMRPDRVHQQEPIEGPYVKNSTTEPANG